jgi:hypothetical protein
MIETMSSTRAATRNGCGLRTIRPDSMGDRALRVTWHPEAEMVVLSLWRDNVCAGSFRIPAADVPALISTLAAGLTTAKAG